MRTKKHIKDVTPAKWLKFDRSYRIQSLDRLMDCLVIDANKFRTEAVYQKGLADDLKAEKRTLERTLLAAKSGADCFVLNGNFWTVQLNGYMVPAIKDCVGLRYLALLFSTPGEEYSFSDLWNKVQRKAPINKIRDDDIRSELESETEQTKGRVKGYHERKEHEAADKPTAEDWKNIAEARRDMVNDVECARKRNDTNGLREAKEQLAKCDAAIKKLYGSPRRPKSYHYAGEDMRSAVSKAINRTLKTIAKTSNPLGEHMKEHFQTRRGCWAYRK